jgi:hypothetical protein
MLQTAIIKFGIIKLKEKNNVRRLKYKSMFRNEYEPDCPKNVTSSTRCTASGKYIIFLKHNL